MGNYWFGDFKRRLLRFIYYVDRPRRTCVCESNGLYRYSIWRLLGNLDLWRKALALDLAVISLDVSRARLSDTEKRGALIAALKPQFFSADFLDRLDLWNIP